MHTYMHDNRFLPLLSVSKIEPCYQQARCGGTLIGLLWWPRGFFSHGAERRPPVRWAGLPGGA